MSAAEVAAKFESELIKKDLDIYAMPEQFLQVTFGSKEVKLGTELPMSDLKTPPTLKWTPEANALYTIGMVDLDQPSRQNPAKRGYKHWLVINVKNADLSTGLTLVKYAPPCPTKGTGLHRYPIMVYKQPYTLGKNVNHGASNRNCFDLAAFARTKDLTGPTAGNFFQTQD